jgi:trigger factor
LEEGSSLYVIYEAAPQVPSVNPKELTVKSLEARKVTDRDIDRAIEEMLLQKAEWTDITDRPVAEGDFVDIDIDKIDEPSYNLCKNARFEVAQGKMGNWMRQLLIGLSPGESAEGMSQRDEHSHPESLSHELEEFKPTLCRITLRAIKTAKLHDLNDEFAQRFKFQNLEDLKNKVTLRLNREAQDERQQLLRQQIERELLEKYHFDVPQSMIQEHITENRDQIYQAARARNPKESVEEDIKQLNAQIAERLDHDIRLYYLAHKVAEEQNLQVSQEEMMHEMIRQMWLESSGQSIINQSMDPQEMRRRLYAHLLITKAMDYLAENASKF